MACTNKQCPLAYMCGIDTREFFEFKTLKGHDIEGNIRYTHGCDHFKKKEMQEKKEIDKKMFDKIIDNIFDEVDEVYGKIEPTELEKNVD